MMLHFFILCQGNKWSAVVAQPGSERAPCRYSKLSALAQEMMCWYWGDEKPHPRQDPALIRNVFKVQQGTVAQRTRPRHARVDLIGEACITQWHNSWLSPPAQPTAVKIKPESGSDLPKQPMSKKYSQGKKIHLKTIVRKQLNKRFIWKK